MKAILVQVRRPAGNARRGFSLVEAVLASAVVAVMLVAGLESVGAAAKTRVLQQEQARGTTLARQLLTEIMQCRYQDPDTETGETRATWDDVSDYDGLSETPPQSRNGTALPGCSGWQRTVRVNWADPASPGDNAGSDSGLKRITVTVISPTGKKTELTGLRSSNSPYERQVQAQTVYVSWASVTLQVGPEASAAAFTGANLVNQVP